MPTTINGTESADILGGTEGSDVIRGFGGNDTITAGGGYDTIWGGDGNDFVSDGADFDEVHGEAGADTILAAIGSVGDIYDGGSNDSGTYDVVDYGYALAGISVDLRQSSGQARSSVDDTASIGVDSLSNIEGIVGSAFTDSIYGDAFDNLLVGAGGSDSLLGFEGNDTLVGGEGDDTLYGGTGNDQLSGGNGNDSLIGNAGDDVLDGDDGDDILTGGLGSDTVNGGAGNDVIMVYFGMFDGSDLTTSDQFAGGSGTDTIWFRGDFTAGLAFDLTGVALGNDIEILNAEFHVQLTALQLSGFGSISGLVTIVGSGSFDFTGNRFTAGLINFDSGDDYATLAGNVSAENGSLSGGGGNDRLIGGEGTNGLSGGDGDDILEGRGGDDGIDGGAGRDTVIGGTGNDRLTGGAGIDTFIFGLGAGSDTIIDFTQARDQIDITAYGFTNFGQILAKATASGGNTTIELASGQILTLSGVALSTLTYEDFIGISSQGTPTINSIIPALPTAPSTPNVLEVIDADGSYTVNAGTILFAMDLAEMFQSPSANPFGPLINHGTIWSDVSYDVSTLAMIGRYNNVRDVHNHGVMVLHLDRATTRNAFGFQETPVSNSGQIFIINEGLGNAWLTRTFLTAPTVNSGFIAVQAQHGMAFGYEFMNANGLDNQAGAQLLVEGHGAIAFFSRFGNSFTPVEVLNAGSIVAHSLDVQLLAFGLYLDGGSTIGGSADRYHVINSGLIAADVAIYGGDDSYTTPSEVIHHVENRAGGVIDGAILLNKGADRLDNSGIVNGIVDMGDGDDIVDTTSGRINGYTELGNGNDQFTGGAFDDEVYGGVGNDSIAGNGGDDYIEGGAGNDNLAGGAGFDVVSYSEASAGVTIDLAISGVAQNSGGAGSDIVSGFEDLVGSEFSDQLYGDGVGNYLYGLGGADILTGRAGLDILTGGASADSFLDTRAGLNGDTITDFANGDRIVLTDASLAGFIFSLTGSTLTYTGGSLTLTGGVSGQLVAGAASGGGVQLTIQASVAIADVRNDFNGDGRSDILWRNVDGQLSNWLGQANGGFTPNNTNAAAVVPTDWQVTGTGDFNGDGRDDILWRHTSGTLSNWLGTTNGGYTPNDANAAAAVPTDWHVVGTGDFNGDGRDDILWRNNDGTLSNWLGLASGGFVANDANAAAPVPTAWFVAGTGDYNGDGRDDILWRNVDGQLSNWLGTASGGFTPNNTNAAAAVPTDWLVVGIGDFNGDGRDDILWRNTNGTLSNWLGTANGGYTPNDANAAALVPIAWTVVAIGDYNGDGRDDILWRHTDGTLSDWLGTASGGFTPNDANAAAPVPTSWHVQPEPFIL